MRQVVDEVALEPVRAFGALDRQKGVAKPSSNEQHHHDAEGKRAEHLADEVTAEFGEVHAELEGAQRHGVSLGNQDVAERFSVFLKVHGLAVSVERPKHGLGVDAVFVEGEPKKRIHGEGFDAADDQAVFRRELIGAKQLRIAVVRVVEVHRGQPIGHELETLLHALVKHFLAQFGRRLEPIHLNGHNDEHGCRHGSHQQRYQSAVHEGKDGATCTDAVTLCHSACMGVNKPSQPVHVVLTWSRVCAGSFGPDSVPLEAKSRRGREPRRSRFGKCAVFSLLRLRPTRRKILGIFVDPPHCVSHAMIPQETVDQIMNAAVIEDVVGDHVELKKSGSSLRGLSPFTNEKTPSFYVLPAKGIFKCFSSGKGGNVVSFLMELEKASYPEALRMLAQRYNIEVEEKAPTPEELAAATAKESLSNLVAWASKWFMDQMRNTDAGKAIGRSYFVERGFRDDVLDTFMIGYSPDSWDAMATAAQEAGYTAEKLVEAGLCKQRDDGSLWDFFKGRVMFPIRDVTGRVIGFGGRTLTTDKKSPSTSTRLRASCTTSPRCSMACIWPNSPSTRRSDASLWKATRTSWPCTKPGSKTWCRRAARRSRQDKFTSFAGSPRTSR